MNRLAITLLLAVAINLPVQAGTFLDITSIPGGSNDAVHMDEIDVLTWGQSVANVNDMPVVLPLVFTHEIDKATPKLIEAAILGTSLESAVLSVTATYGDGERIDFLVLTLTHVRVVSINSSGASGGLNAEEVTLTCNSFELTYREIDDNGSIGPPIEVEGSCGN